MKKAKDIIIKIFFIIVTISGLLCILYPTISDAYNSWQQYIAIDFYNKKVENLEEENYEKYIAEAQEYNERLYDLDTPLLDGVSLDGYEDILNPDGTGVMGYVNIKSIDVRLPIYHGTDTKTLETSIGHIQGTSVPIGGENTHSVIAAHSGLKSARLFTDIDKLQPGDEFSIVTLDKVLVYEVDKISIVFPEETKPLEIIDGGDYVTLQTCTPYGINSHRLLVRGKHTHTYNVDDAEAEQYIVGDDMKTVLTNKRNLTPVIIVFFIILFFVILRIFRNKRHESKKEVSR